MLIDLAGAIVAVALTALLVWLTPDGAEPTQHVVRISPPSDPRRRRDRRPRD